MNSKTIERLREIAEEHRKTGHDAYVNLYYIFGRLLTTLIESEEPEQSSLEKARELRNHFMSDLKTTRDMERICNQFEEAIAERDKIIEQERELAYRLQWERDIKQARADKAEKVIDDLVEWNQKMYDMDNDTMVRMYAKKAIDKIKELQGGNE